MPLASGASKNVISANIAQLIDEGYSQDQAVAIAHSHAQDSDESQRVEDDNGWFTVERQPISCVGVFDYAGYRLPKEFGLDPDAMFAVLRPPQSLSDPKFLESLRLLPWVDEHDMLGPEEVDRTPAETKGVHGVTGELQEFDAESGTVYSNIKCFSESQRDNIDAGKKELSLGYVCKYLDKPGEWQGKPYRFIQVQMRGNHLASVDEGRMGSFVAVLDSKDPKRGTQQMDFDVSNMTLEELAALIKAAKEAKGVLEAATSEGDDDAAAKTDDPALAGAAGADDDDEGEDVGAEAGKAAMEDEDDETQIAAKAGAKKGEGADDDSDKDMAGDGALSDGSSSTLDEDEEGKDGTGEDARDRRVVAMLSRRDRLAKRLKPFIGVFDHSAMTEKSLAKYACKKLKLNVAVGTEVAACAAYLHNRAAPAARTSVKGNGMDSADRSFLQRQLKDRG